MACGDMPRMRPLADWPLPARSGTRGVLADIDDTLTTDGRVPAAVFAAMERLRANGLLVIAVTGRPAGWCDMIARTWPVDGVVGENGALAFRHDPAARHMVRIYADSPQSRAENRARLERVRDDILAAIPGVRVAADQPFRETDLAIDFNEDVSGLAPETPQAVVGRFEAHGATAKISSIHVNGWFGTYDKLTMTRRLLCQEFGADLDAEREHFVFIGDSPNDSPMFGYFPNAVGVANLAPFSADCAHLPAWLTAGERSEGFVELAEQLLDAIR